MYGGIVARSIANQSGASCPPVKRIANDEDESDKGRLRGCLACRGPTCTWRPCHNTEVLSQHREQLYQELRHVEKLNDATVQSTVARSASRNGNQHLMKELADEMFQIDSKLKLCSIDEELHRCYASSADVSPLIRSIHGYDTSTRRTKDAILALEHERDKHIARIAALETIDGILEWMLEGKWRLCLAALSVEIV